MGLSPEIRREKQYELVAEFWHAAISKSEDDKSAAWRAASEVESRMIEDPRLREEWEWLTQRFVAGENMDPGVVIDEVGSRDREKAKYLTEVTMAMASPARVGGLVKMVVRDWQSRRAVAVLDRAKGLLVSGRGDRDGGMDVMQRLSLASMELYANGGHRGVYKSRDELLDDARDRAMVETVTGVPLPWPKLNHAIGPLRAGEVAGICAWPGQGKSTWMANLFFQMAKRRIPVIGFPTEMRDQWIDRGLAAEAWVEQRVAEKGLWPQHPEQREKFLAVVEEARKWEWMAVNRSEISPQEVLMATRVLRQKWPGQTVVVFVDHMHRLSYGADRTADEEAGTWTKAFKNAAGDDQSGGLVWILAYHPRKPPQGGSIHRAPEGFEVRGHGSAWGEMDLNLALFRPWVKTDERRLTEWGTPKTFIHMDTQMPRIVRARSDESKVDDEHVWMKVDKQRIGGEGPIVLLNIHKPSGRIMEFDRPEAGGSGGGEKPDGDGGGDIPSGLPWDY